MKPSSTSGATSVPIQQQQQKVLGEAHVNGEWRVVMSSSAGGAVEQQSEETLQMPKDEILSNMAVQTRREDDTEERERQELHELKLTGDLSDSLKAFLREFHQSSTDKNKF